MDYQGHKVNAPTGDSRSFAQRLVQLALNFQENSKTSPIPYALFGDNCAAWVNTLFKVAGVSFTDRMRAGQFWGIDACEKKEIPDKMFVKQR